MILSTSLNFFFFSFLKLGTGQVRAYLVSIFYILFTCAGVVVGSESNRPSVITYRVSTLQGKSTHTFLCTEKRERFEKIYLPTYPISRLLAYLCAHLPCTVATYVINYLSIWQIPSTTPYLPTDLPCTYPTPTLYLPCKERRASEGIG